MNMKIIKLGGSIITKKKGWQEANLENIRMLAKVVAKVWKKSDREWILIHGAGSFGHPLVIEYDLNNGVKSTKQKLGMARTHKSCIELSMLLVDALQKEGVPAISIPPAAITISKNKRIYSFDGKKVEDYLEAGFFPVLFGDMVPDIELGGSVCSGDQLISYLGKKAELIIHATNVDGVLDDSGNVIPVITKANFHEMSVDLTKKDKDVTGAMKGKISELLGLDTPSIIINGLKAERVEAAMLGKKVYGTMVGTDK